MPHPPGSYDGVGDYALSVAQELASNHKINTIFAAGERSASNASGDFDLRLLDRSGTGLTTLARSCDHALLHYVNYGYEPRGLPFWLPPLIAGARSAISGRWITAFHEIYASVPPWKSAFWLQPWQKRIAKAVAVISDAAVVSNETARDQLLRLRPGLQVMFQPVPSNFGEVQLILDQVTKRDPHRWVICGGTALLERGLRSLIAAIDRLPTHVQPREIVVLGGRRNPAVEKMLNGLSSVRSTYLPEISRSKASEVLASSSFGWLDYFDRRDRPSTLILKSASFAAYCAHAVIPVFPHHVTKIAFSDQPLPGPFFLTNTGNALPSESDRARIAWQCYEWYQRHASIAALAQKIAALLP